MLQKWLFWSIGTIVFLTMLFCGLVHAEMKSVTAEASYQMGDGESPSFAESMVLRKAKQHALEEAGTYIESNTVIQNGKLTQDEVRAVAGGLMTVEVLDKSRGLVGDGLVFKVKIRASVNTDNLSDLVRRIKDKGIAEEYKALQEEYRKLYADFEQLKDLAKTAPAGVEREAALDQIRESEKAFATVEKNEATLFQRMVSGEKLFGKALTQIGRKTSERESVDALFQKIVNEGLIVSISEPKIDATLEMQKKGEVSIYLPVTIEMVNPIITLIEERSLSFGGKVEEVKVDFSKRINNNLYYDMRWGKAVLISSDFETVKHFQESFISILLVIELMDGKERIAGCNYDPFTQGWKALPVVPLNVISKYITLSGVSYYKGNKLMEGSGYVAFLNPPPSITFIKEVLLKDAIRITSVRGKFISVPLPVLKSGANYTKEYAHYKKNYDGLYSCKIEPYE